MRNTVNECSMKYRQCEIKLIIILLPCFTTTDTTACSSIRNIQFRWQTNFKGILQVYHLTIPPGWITLYSEIFEVNFVLTHFFSMVFLINNFLWNNILRNVFLHWKYAHMQNLILGKVLQSPSKKACPTVGPQFAGLPPQLEGTVNLSGIWIFFKPWKSDFCGKATFGVCNWCKYSVQQCEFLYIGGNY